MDFSLVSRHFWRGILTSTGPTAESTVSYTAGKANLGIWGATSFNKSYSEVDFFVGYSFKNWSFTMYDYFCPVWGKPNNFADFESDTSRHTIDIEVAYNGSAKLPFTLKAATFVYGSDEKTPSGNRVYSTYIEAGAFHNFGEINLKTWAGFTPYKSYYASKPRLMNLGLSATRNFKITEKLTMPVKLLVYSNPYRKDMNIVLGVTIY
jgi:hypothetical protein